MKKSAIALCSMVLGAAIVAPAQTAQPTKIGIINIQAAIIGTREGQAAAKELETKSAPKKKELEKLQSEINALRDQYNKIGSVGSEEQKRKLAGDIDAKTKSFNRQVEDAQAELDGDQQRVLNELGGRMLAVLDKYAKDNAFAIILDVSQQNTPVLFAANGIDVTQDVVALYDKNAPAATPGATPGAAPATSAPATSTPPAAKPAGAKPAAPKPGTVK